MKLSKDAVSASGLSVLYEPAEPSAAILDIVLVSGLGGHPVRTWQYSNKAESPRSPKSPGRKGSFRELLRKNSLKKCTSDSDLKGGQGSEKPRERRVLRKNPSLEKAIAKARSKSLSRLSLDLSQLNAKEEPGPRRNNSTRTAGQKRSTSRLRLELQDNVADNLQPELEVYWPLDLLPESCPNTRIMTWGSQTLATNGKLLPAQNHVFAHADELLHDLATLRDDTRSFGRSIVFVAHSLGGVVVKELLRRSETMSEPSMKDILQSTLATIFLGCPHRDSQYGRLGDAVKSMASATLRVDADDPVLRDLSGASSASLNLGRQVFVRLWNDYNFRVKTFQEQTPVSSTLREARPEHVLRREASSFGDPREQAEPIETNHLDMCKFKSAGDPVYRSLSFTLTRYVHDEINRLRPLSHKEHACLRELVPLRIPPRETQRTDSYPGTCLWLYDMPEFRAWHHRVNGARHKMLWIKGRPGSGKSVLLNSLRGRVEKQWGPLGSAFVWSIAEGNTLDSVFFPGTHRRQYETSPAGVYRSVLAQLFRLDPRLRKAMVSMHKINRNAAPQPLDDAQVVTFFADDYIDQRVETPTKRTFIFIDAADDCGVPYLTDLLYYFAQLAVNSDFSICVASASHPEIVIDNTVEVVMHRRNVDDILRYISLNLVAEWEDRNRTVVRIGDKTGGCFLWAEIVVNILNSAIEEGASQELIEDTVMDMPDDVDGLYEWLFGTLGPEEKAETLALLQWVILATEPPRLNDLRIAVRLTRTWHPEGFKPYMALQTMDSPTSIRDLRRPVSEGGAFDTPYQFHRWIRSRSIGLVELRPETKDGVMYEPLGLQRVQVIHESVRTFFLSGRGFACLSTPYIDNDLHELNLYSTTRPTADLIDEAHYALLHACLSYLNMADFEPLGRQGSTLPLAPMPFEESKYWRKNVRDQRRLVMSSYPFLQYAVDNLLFHLLSPRFFRYYLPQTQILRAFSANRCRLWRRWTALMGCSVGDAAGMLARCADGPAGELLDPVFGAQYRLERVFRKLSRLALAESQEGGGVDTPKSARSLRRLRSVSEKWSPQSSSFKSPAPASMASIFSPLSSMRSPMSSVSMQSERPTLSPVFAK